MSPESRMLGDESQPVKRRSRTARALTAGSMPYAIVIPVAVATFAAGWLSAPHRVPVALVQKSAVVMEAMLDRPQMTRAELEAQVARPAMGVLQRYARMGYEVIDAGATESGGYEVLALPPDSIDITDELRAALHLPPLARPRVRPPAAQIDASHTPASTEQPPTVPGPDVAKPNGGTR